jgi:hypothetical protein
MKKFKDNQIVRLQDKALGRVESYEDGMYTVVNFNTMEKEVLPENVMKKIPKSLERRL